MTVTVPVPLGERAYPIRIGDDLLAGAGTEIGPLLRRPRLAVVTDETVAGLHLATLQASLADAGIDAPSLVLAPGEATKNWAGLERVVEWLIAERVNRDDLVLAFGGGVVGDLVGFAAAVLRRGVGFVQMPTTLLAQVDSSVGGKTGINSPQGKNLVGAFHQPRLVLADIGLLGTLAPRDFLAGYAEVAKYGLLGDARFFGWLEANAASVAGRDPEAMLHIVRRSCEMKAEIVVRDETEQGDRALLNLGHTFGHALEAATGYCGRLLHGEAVAIGCVLAFDLSVRLGLCPEAALDRVSAHLAAMGMRHRLGDVPGELPDAAGLVALMGQDKKVRDGRLAFILATDIGSAFVARDVELAAVEALLADRLRTRGS